MARLLMAALERAGHSVTLASKFRSYEGTGDPALQRAISTRGQEEAKRLLASWKKGAAPELWLTYHLYYKAPDWLGPIVARELGIPYVAIEPSHAPKRAGGAWDVGHRAAAEAIGKADALLCMTQLDLGMVRPVAKPGALVEHLPPFLDTADFAAAAKAREQHRKAVAERHGLDAKQVWLLAVGMMRGGDKLDSYRMLGRALPLVKRPKWQLLVVGDGPERAAVTSALGPQAIYLGEQPLEAMPGIYAAADLLVWPAMGEAYGMALLEAQAAGLPVLAGRLRGVGDVVQDGKTAVLVPADDFAAFPKRFATALDRLIGTPAERRKLGTAALAHGGQRDIAAAAAALDRVLHAVRR